MLFKDYKEFTSADQENCYRYLSIDHYEEKFGAHGIILEEYVRGSSKVLDKVFLHAIPYDVCKKLMGRFEQGLTIREIIAIPEVPSSLVIEKMAEVIEKMAEEFRSGSTETGHS